MESTALLRPVPAGRQGTRTSEWLMFLPAEWRSMVIEPIYFKQHREYEIAASRSFGYDADDCTCYYAHRYALNEIRSDDDEDFYEVVAYGESVHAWRLRDERWLIYRIAHTAGDSTPGRGFFSFADRHPR